MISCNIPIKQSHVYKFLKKSDKRGQQKNNTLRKLAKNATNSKPEKLFLKPNDCQCLYFYFMHKTRVECPFIFDDEHKNPKIQFYFKFKYKKV